MMDPNALNGAQLAILQEAILSAFTKPELNQLLSHGDRDEIDNIVEPGTFETQVLELIKLSQREGWTDWLISSILEERPRNSRISELVADLELAATDSTEAPNENSHGRVTPSETALPSTIDPINTPDAKRGIFAQATVVSVGAIVAFVVIGWFALQWGLGENGDSPLLECDTKEPSSELIDTKTLVVVRVYVNTEAQLGYADKLRSDISKLGFNSVTIEGPGDEFGGFPEKVIETRYFSTINSDNACRVSVLADQSGPYRSITSPLFEFDHASREIEVWFPSK